MKTEGPKNRFTGTLFVPESILPSSHRYGSALERQLSNQRARRTADPLLSLVVPVFNEEDSIDLFLDTVAALMERDGLRFEIVFVNDGRGQTSICHASFFDDRRLRAVGLSQFRKVRDRQNDHAA